MALAGRASEPARGATRYSAAVDDVEALAHDADAADRNTRPRCRRNHQCHRRPCRIGEGGAGGAGREMDANATRAGVAPSAEPPPLARLRRRTADDGAGTAVAVARYR